MHVLFAELLGFETICVEIENPFGVDFNVRVCSSFLVIRIALQPSLPALLCL